MAKNEPQSYGSDTPPEGGSSPEESQPVGPPSGDAHTPVQKVTAQEGGARRDSYFKDRDYKS
jgi:hypothetical protein